MDFSLIDTLDGLDALAADWNALLAEGITNTPFLRHEYLRAWWQGLGGGEWPQGSLCVVTARREGRLAGIAPFFRSLAADGRPVLVLLGGIEISDYLDLIVRPDDLRAFVPGWLGLLSGLEGWDRIEAYNLPSASPSLAVIREQAARLGWAYEQQPFRPSMVVPLPGDWEAYLAGIDKKQRHEIRRKMRRAEESGRGVRWSIVEDASQLEAGIESLLALMSTDDEKRRFLTPAMRTQMGEVARAAWRAGWLQLAFLEVDGQKVCGYLNFDYDNRIWVYNSGLDPRFMELSPGWVLLGHLLEWANRHGRAAFDFMRGDEDYKVKFGGQRREVVKFIISKTSEVFNI